VKRPAFRRTPTARTRLAWFVLALLGMLAPLSPLASPAQVSADTIDDQRRRVAQIVDELERLASQADELGEKYSDTLAEKYAIEADISATEVKIFELQKQLAVMQANLVNSARRSFVTGGSAGSLSSILGGSGSLTDSIKRAYLGSAAANIGVSNTDAMQGLIDDITAEKSKLERQKKQLASTATFLAGRLSASDRLLDQYESLRSQATRDLGNLLTEEERRREQEAESNARKDSEKFKSTFKVVASSPQAGVAIKAALTQLGVRYRWGASSPGVAFDCSGLTQWAWAKAGVSIPRVSRSQYAALTRVPISQAQPGDLLFSQGSFFHVGIYLGNGQMVQAPRTGDVVKISTVTWTRVIGVGRPK
jgi:cell wall-associated NlpC family hydrolase